jgi:phospholipase C
MDHVVLVLFENRSFDNLLGHLYGPEDGKTFEGVIGKNLSNPIPEWAERGAERRDGALHRDRRHGCAKPGLG